MRKLIQDKGLVVSCQAYENEPLFGSHHMVEMAKATELGGAVGIRANSLSDIDAVKQTVRVPVNGLYKRKYEGDEVYITPTLEDALAVHAAGVDSVALDATRRPRPDGKTLEEVVRELLGRNMYIMADNSTWEEGVYAAELGFHYISTTLSGYTPYSPQISKPDLHLVARLAKDVRVPVAAEGRISTTQEVIQELDSGAQFVVMGSAITRPQLITERFTQVIQVHLNLSHWGGSHA